MAYAYDAQLTIEERNLLSVAYKNITNELRNSWRVIDCLETLEASRSKSRRLILIRQERNRIERELANTCKDVVKVGGKRLCSCTVLNYCRFRCSMRNFFHAQDWEKRLCFTLRCNKFLYLSLTTLTKDNPIGTGTTIGI